MAKRREDTSSFSFTRAHLGEPTLIELPVIVETSEERWQRLYANYNSRKTGKPHPESGMLRERENVDNSFAVNTRDLPILYSDYNANERPYTHDPKYYHNDSSEMPILTSSALNRPLSKPVAGFQKKLTLFENMANRPEPLVVPKSSKRPLSTDDLDNSADLSLLISEPSSSGYSSGPSSRPKLHEESGPTEEYMHNLASGLPQSIDQDYPAKSENNPTGVKNRPKSDYMMNYTSLSPLDTMQSLEFANVHHVKPYNEDTFGEDLDENKSFRNPDDFQRNKMAAVPDPWSKFHTSDADVALIPKVSQRHRVAQSAQGSVSSDRSSRFDSQSYQSYAAGILNTTQRSDKFIHLQKNFNTLGRIAEIEERTLKKSLPYDQDYVDQLKSKYKLESIEELQDLYDELDEAQRSSEFYYDLKNLPKFRWNQRREYGLLQRQKSLGNLTYFYDNMDCHDNTAAKIPKAPIVRRDLSYSKLCEKYQKLDGESRNEITFEQFTKCKHELLSGSYIEIMESVEKKSKVRALYGSNIDETPNQYDVYVDSMRTMSKSTPNIDQLHVRSVSAPYKDIENAPGRLRRSNSSKESYFNARLDEKDEHLTEFHQLQESVPKTFAHNIFPQQTELNPSSTSNGKCGSKKSGTSSDDVHDGLYKQKDAQCVNGDQVPRTPSPSVQIYDKNFAGYNDNVTPEHQRIQDDGRTFLSVDALRRHDAATFSQLLNDNKGIDFPRLDSKLSEPRPDDSFESKTKVLVKTDNDRETSNTTKMPSPQFHIPDYRNLAINNDFSKGKFAKYERMPSVDSFKSKHLPNNDSLSKANIQSVPSDSSKSGPHLDYKNERSSSTSGIDDYDPVYGTLRKWKGHMDDVNQEKYGMLQKWQATDLNVSSSFDSTDTVVIKNSDDEYFPNFSKSAPSGEGWRKAFASDGKEKSKSEPDLGGEALDPLGPRLAESQKDVSELEAAKFSRLKSKFDGNVSSHLPRTVSGDLKDIRAKFADRDADWRAIKEPESLKSKPSTLPSPLGRGYNRHLEDVEVYTPPKEILSEVTRIVESKQNQEPGYVRSMSENQGMTMKYLDHLADEWEQTKAREANERDFEEYGSTMEINASVTLDSQENAVKRSQLTTPTIPPPIPARPKLHAPVFSTIAVPRARRIPVSYDQKSQGAWPSADPRALSDSKGTNPAAEAAG